MEAVNKKRRVVCSDAREIVVRVYNFLKDEYKFMKENHPDKSDLSYLAKITQRTAKATGVSERTVTRFLHEERILASCAPVALCNEDKSRIESDIDETKLCVTTTPENDEEKDVKNINGQIKMENDKVDIEYNECNIVGVTIKTEYDFHG